MKEKWTYAHIYTIEPDIMFASPVRHWNRMPKEILTHTNSTGSRQFLERVYTLEKLKAANFFDHENNNRLSRRRWSRRPRNNRELYQTFAKYFIPDNWTAVGVCLCVGTVSRKGRFTFRTDLILFGVLYKAKFQRILIVFFDLPNGNWIMRTFCTIADNK